MMIILKKRSLIVGLGSLVIFVLAVGFSYLAYHSPQIECTGQNLVVPEVIIQKKAVAFTFDDGPDPQGTTAILQVLKKHKAHATFFVIGTQIEKYPYLVKQAFGQGHEIGNHGYTHSYRLYRNVDQAFLDIKKNEQLIYTLTRQRPNLFRPPGGYLSEALADAAPTHGITIVTWSWIQDTKDWRNPPAERQAAHILKHIRPGQILIFHDGGGDRTQTVRTVDMCMEKLVKQGYWFVTVSELIELGKDQE